MSATTHSSRLSTPPRRLVSFLAIMAYLFSGLTIVVINKSIVRDHGLHMPALVSSTGALLTAALTRILVLLGQVKVKPVGRRPWEFGLRRALPVGICAAGSLCFGNMSYIYLDAGFIQMLKAGTPALLLLVLSCLRIEHVSATTGGLALVMVAGSSFATAQQPNATAVGLFIQMMSQVCEVMQCTAVQFFLQHLGFEVWDAGYYIAPAVAACCLLPSLIFEWPHIIADHKLGLLYEEVPLLLASGLVGIIVQISSLVVIKFTSSLLAKLLVIVRSAALVLLFIAAGEIFTWLQVLGYGITISAFLVYTVVKTREMAMADREEQLTPAASQETREAEADEGGEGLLPDAQGAAGAQDGTSSWDLTSFMFWFAACVILAEGYQATVQAAVFGSIGSPCGEWESELNAQKYSTASSNGVPPTPYLEPVTAGTHHWGALSAAKGGSGLHTAGMISVATPAKVLHLGDGRFMLHAGGSIVLAQRTPETLLSSSWLISSKQFGTVHLSALDNRGEQRWLTCDLALVADVAQACLLWMTAARWDQWASEEDAGEYVFRMYQDDSKYLSADGNFLKWRPSSSSFHVVDWLPEACPLKGMTPSIHSYSDAMGEVTFTMTTFFHVYARSIMFRQALSSVFRHMRERDFYVREFLVANDWYEGNSLNFNGSFTGPTVKETRHEMETFFPGCRGVNVDEAHRRPSDQKCTFVFKDPDHRGQPNALNVLLDLMVTKFWIHFEDDHVFYQDVFVSRLLAPMYEHPDSCWNYERRVQGQRLKGSSSRLSLAGDHGVDGRRLRAEPPCRVIGGVRLGSKAPIGFSGRTDSYELEDYRVPDILFNNSYVRALLAHGGFDEDKLHGWGSFAGVGAVSWPLFSLRPSLLNLTYIKSLEAPLFYGGRPGRFSEDENISRWRDGGKVYSFHWDFELEFAVRWARKGATLASLSPGACMRDISNGISSFERSFEYR